MPGATQLGFDPLFAWRPAVIGIPTFVAGIAAAFLTTNGPGSAALVTIGGVFLLLAVLGNRVEALELGGATVSLREVARSRFALATKKEADDPITPRDLRAQGRALQRLANEYSQVRRSMRPGRDRAEALEHILAETEQLARDYQFRARRRMGLARRRSLRNPDNRARPGNGSVPRSTVPNVVDGGVGASSGQAATAGS
jgi:hypothetical protein